MSVQRINVDPRAPVAVTQAPVIQANAPVDFSGSSATGVNIKGNGNTVNVITIVQQQRLNLQGKPF